MVYPFVLNYIHCLIWGGQTNHVFPSDLKPQQSFTSGVRRRSPASRCGMGSRHTATAGTCWLFSEWVWHLETAQRTHWGCLPCPVYVVLGVEPKASCMLGECSSRWTIPVVFFFFKGRISFLSWITLNSLSSRLDFKSHSDPSLSAPHILGL